MNKLTQHITGFYLVLFLIITAATAEGGTKTFPTGSYIIPQDLCWQPTKYYPDSPRPITVEICGNSYDDDLDGTVDEANTALLPYNCYNLTGCDTNKNDQGVFQSTGLIYEILTAGYPVYWIINPNKTDQIGVDLSITKSGTDPAVTILHSTSPTPKTDSGTLATVEYRGGPFMIDANDYDTVMQTLFDKYLSVKLHKSNYDFSAEVDKVLSGKPPDVAVLGEGSVQVLTDYLFASGLANQQAVVFKYLTTANIIADGLDNYQLMWAPHWEIDKEVPVVADRTTVLGKMRSFLEKGNAGFFECASIESLERAFDVSKGTSAPSSYYTGQGIVLDKNYNDIKGRLQINGGTQNYNKIKLEHFTNVLTQCGGWRYNTTGGHVHNLRPSEVPDPDDYVYNSTVDRFLHDDETRTDLGYTGKGYDYYIGGRINGSATQGYVAYLAGHKYVKCSNATTSIPSTRFFEVDFTAAPSLVSSTIIYVEAVYSGCVSGSTCPKASFDINAQTGTYSTDGTVFVDLDSSEYTADADPPTKYILNNLTIGNKNTTTDKVITGINVTFSGNTPTTLLTEIRDVTLTPSTTVCTPNSPTPASCPSIAKKYYDFNFDAALVSPTTVEVKVVYGGCTTGCPTATYDLATAVGTTGGDGTISIDMSVGVTYDSVNKKLKGVAISNLSAAAKTLDRFNVTFSGNGATKLTTAQDVTTTTTTVCTSDETSAANCPPATATPVEKTNTFEFANDFTSGAIQIEVVHAGCTQGSTCSKATATATSGNPTGGTVSSTDGKVKIDMTAATFNHGSKILGNVKLSNLTGTAITVTKFYVYIGADKKLKKIKDGGTTLYSNSSGLDVNPGQTVTLSTTETLTISTQTLNITLAASSPLSITLAKALTECVVDWGSANACGMKYVLNTLIGLQFQVIPNEYNKAGAIQQDNILYKGAFEYPGYKGHLESINVTATPATTNWDAGKAAVMPKAGITNNPASPANNLINRYIFSNIPGTTTKIGFEVANAGTAQTDTTKLWHYLDPGATNTLNGVKALIHSVRGRKNASDVDVDGTGEVSKRLGGVEHSSPAVMTKSKLAGAASRDRVVFVGGHDGMLHAFYAGTWNTSTETYSVGSGKEIWAYIPSTLLGSLQEQTFTDCNPSEVLVGCTVSLVDPIETCVCPIFSVAVTVDGSPALGDFFVDHDNNSSTPKQWRTILVETAKVMTPGASSVSVNQGIIFALDVTDPYSPSVLWERTYNAAVDTSVSPGNAIKRNYYPPSTFTTTYKTVENTSFDPNMGDAKGVAIGRVQVGTTLDTYVFLTSRWVRQVDVSATATPHNVWGLSVFALDFYSGDIRWETKIAYTADPVTYSAEGVNEPPATPALLDYGNNGTYDYVVLGDMQGRLWVLKSIDGKTINSTGAPAYTVGNGAKEPIGASVAIYKNTIVFGTGGRDSLQDESTTPYHLYAIEINSKGEVTDLWTPPYALNAGEKIWSSPVIDGSGAVYVGTAKGYTDVGRPDMMSASSGRLLVLELSTGTLKKDSSNNDMVVDLGGAVIGDIAIESNHVTLQLFDGTTIQIGGGDFTSTVSQENPVKVLWWRKL